MKNTKLILTLLAFTGIIKSDPGCSMMTSMELLQTTSRVAVKRTPPLIIQRRAMNTQGYKPLEQIKTDFQFDNITKEKIRFTDKSHERYRTEVTDPSFKERITTTEQKDDHTLVVNIKKRDEVNTGFTLNYQSDSANHSVVSSPFRRLGSDVVDSLFDKRKEVPNFSEYPWVINAQLISIFPSGEKSRGTATLVNENCLVTAGHCLYDDDEGGLATSVVLFFGRYNDRFLIKSISNKFIVHPEYIKNDENFDFALINLAEDVGKRFGWASIKVFDDKELDKKIVNVSGYPGTKGFFNTIFSRPSHKMYTMKGQIVSVKKHKIYYDLDTSGGQSGSAVWAPDINGMPECLAIHTTGKSPRVEGNGAVRINEENFDILKDWVNFYQKNNNS